MIALALVLQLQAASIATGTLELARPRLLTTPVSLARSNLQLVPAEERGEAPRSGGVRAGQILAGTGLHLLVAVPSVAVAFFSMFCGIAESSSRDCDGYTALGLVGLGAFVFGAPAMATLGAKWAAAGEAHIGAGTYWWAVLANLAALGGGIGIVAAVHGPTGLMVGIVAGALGASTVAALTLEYPSSSPPDVEAGLPRLGELARPVSSPTPAAPAARSGVTAPLVAFRW